MLQAVSRSGVLTIEEVPFPIPTKGQALVRVEASGVGQVDRLMALAIADTFVPGVEVVGVVSSVGPDADEGWVGQRVFTMVPMGGYAEFLVVDAEALVPLPEGLEAGDALAIGTNALVAQYALDCGRVVAGERLLVRGATGGIGVMAVQLATQRGCKVIATQRNDSADRLRLLGAAEVACADAADSGEFDIVIDLVAGAAVADFMKLLRPGGRYVLAGIAGGMPPEDFAAPLIQGFRRSLSVLTCSLDTMKQGARFAALRELFQAAVDKRLTPVIAHRFSLNEATRAHDILSAGGLFGKIILLPTFESDRPILTI